LLRKGIGTVSALLTSFCQQRKRSEGGLRDLLPPCCQDDRFANQDLRSSCRKRSSAVLPCSRGKDSVRNSTSFMRSRRKKRKSSRSSHQEPASQVGGGNPKGNGRPCRRVSRA